MLVYIDPVYRSDSEVKAIGQIQGHTMKIALCCIMSWLFSLRVMPAQRTICSANVFSLFILVVLLFIA